MVLFKRKKGFTLIEGLIALAIFVILVTVFYRIFSQTAIHMADGKQRRAAVSLANERMEHYRNLAYAEVGTTTNVPLGNIIADENITINDMTFRIISSVFLVDDPFDGRAANGTDLIPNDYKRVSVSIIWDKCVSNTIYSRSIAEYGGACSAKRIRLVSQFVPPGGLETIESGGILSINVLDAEANAISDVIVTIDDGTHPAFPLPETGGGNYMYIGAPACDDCYAISVSKNDYESLSTQVSPGTKNVSSTVGDVSYFPRFVNQSVSDGLMTTMTFIMQKQSDLVVSTEDPAGNSIADIDFAVQGGHVIGTNLNENPLYVEQDVYGFYDEMTTDTNGEIIIRTDTNDDGSITNGDCLNVSEQKKCVNTGPFTFTLLEDEDANNELDYVFWKMVPGLDTNAQKVNVNADATIDAQMILLERDQKSVFFHVINSDGTPVNGANVYLYDNNDTPTYSETQKTDAYGYAYFPTRSESEPYDVVPLIEEDMEYEYIVLAGGYEVYDNDHFFTINEDKLYEIEVILTAE